MYNKIVALERFEFIKRIQSVFTKKVCYETDWNVAHSTFPLFVQLLDIDVVQGQLLNGIVYSIGSLTESLIKPVNLLFIKELKRLNKENKLAFRKIIKLLVDLARSQIQSDRLGVSIVTAVDLIVQNDLIEDEDLLDVGEEPDETPEKRHFPPSPAP